PANIDGDVAAQLLVEGWLARERSLEDARLISRLKFAALPFNLSEMISRVSRGARSLADVRLERALPQDVMRALDRDASEQLEVPSGRLVRLEYGDDGTVSASAKLQELFGLAE